MARKTLSIKIDLAGRDAGKRFLITEMSAARAEAWAMRALLALMNQGVHIPEDIQQSGMAGVAYVGLQMLNGLKWEVAEPLLAEMMECVQIQPDPRHPEVARNLIDDDIEEVKTRLFLRRKVLELHVDFFTDGDLLQTVRSAVAAGSA